MSDKDNQPPPTSPPQGKRGEDAKKPGHDTKDWTIPATPATASSTTSQSELFPKIGPFLGDPLKGGEEVVEDAPQPSPQSEKVMKVEDAIRKLREKMAAIATEFAEGKINQAQFEAVYNRYQEQRIITESLLARDPTTDAWQHVLSEGPTTYLRSQHEARLTAYVLYLNRSAKPILKHGELTLDPQVMMTTIKRLRDTGSGRARTARVAEGQWLTYVAGRHTTAIAIYSNEPTVRQLGLIGDLHEDFETANYRNLTSEQFSPVSLVFPQRALFES